MPIHLVRHGETTAPDGRCVGHEDVSLSDAGRTSIERLAHSWTGPLPDRLVSSDLQRARASASVFANRWDIGMHTTGDLRELDFGDWTGRTWDEIEATDEERLQQWMQDWVDVAPPGGESFRELSSRVEEWRKRAATDGAELTLLVVAHAGPIRALLCRALDLPLDRAFRMQVDCAGVSTLTKDPVGWRVHCLNAPAFRNSGDP